MGERPRISIEKNVLQKWFDVAGLTFLFLCFVYVILEWSGLPNRVPIHFNASGEADNWGGKAALLALPIVGVIIWSGLSILERFPHVYNYVVKITEGNAALQYRSAVTLIHFLKNTIAILFAYLTIETVSIANGAQEGLTPWILPIFLTVIFGSILFYIVHSVRWR